MANGAIKNTTIKTIAVGMQTFTFNNSEVASINLASIAGVEKGRIFSVLPNSLLGWGLHVPLFYYNASDGTLVAFIDSNTLQNFSPKASFRISYI